MFTEYGIPKVCPLIVVMGTRIKAMGKDGCWAHVWNDGLGCEDK